MLLRRSNYRRRFSTAAAERAIMQPLRVILLVTAGPETGNRHELDRKGRCLIGRADDCDILLGRKGAGFDISRHHCELEFDPPKLWLRDLGSRNGTYLNGH